jgi:hypothetical protein
VKRTGQVVRGGVRIAGGYRALRSSAMSLLGYGERAGVGPRCHPLPRPLLSLSPTLLETLAAAMALHIVHHCYGPSSRPASREVAASSEQIDQEGIVAEVEANEWIRQEAARGG